MEYQLELDAPTSRKLIAQSHLVIKCLRQCPYLANTRFLLWDPFLEGAVTVTVVISQPVEVYGGHSPIVLPMTITLAAPPRILRTMNNPCQAFWWILCLQWWDPYGPPFLWSMTAEELWMAVLLINLRRGVGQLPPKPVPGKSCAPELLTKKPFHNGKGHVFRWDTLW